MPRTIYILNIEVMNGSVSLSSNISAYSCKEMRQAVKDKLQDLNKDKDVRLRYTEHDVPLYESIGEVPIMNDLVKGTNNGIYS